MDMTIVVAIVQLGMFSAFIHAIIEVFKGIVVRPINFVVVLFKSVFKGTALDEDTIKSLVFILALLYCKTFDFDAMTDILKVTIAPTNSFGWWLAYIGTASVVYVGVDVFYTWLKKVKAMVSEEKPPGG